MNECNGELRERVAALETGRTSDQRAVELVAKSLEMQLRALGVLLFLAIAFAGLLLKGH